MRSIRSCAATTSEPYSASREVGSHALRVLFEPATEWVAAAKLDVREWERESARDWERDSVRDCEREDRRRREDTASDGDADAEEEDGSLSPALSLTVDGERTEAEAARRCCCLLPGESIETDRPWIVVRVRDDGEVTAAEALRRWWWLAERVGDPLLLGRSSFAVEASTGRRCASAPDDVAISSGRRCRREEVGDTAAEADRWWRALTTGDVAGEPRGDTRAEVDADFEDADVGEN